MTGKELSKEEKQEVVQDIGVLLDKTKYFAFDAHHLLTQDEMMLFSCANGVLGVLYEKVAKRYKVKI